MKTTYQWEIGHKSGLVDAFQVTAESIREAWWIAERLTGAGTITTAKVRNPQTLGDSLWHSLTEAKRLEHIERLAA